MPRDPLGIACCRSGWGGVSGQGSLLQLSSIFPNRKRLPWPETPPHPLLQHAGPIGSRGTEFHTVFHNKLIELYSNHVIQGRTIFPGAGYIEMGIAAGALMSTKGIEDGVELWI